MIENNVTGIILAGGESRRMGHDKGLCEFNGKTLVEYAITLVSEFTDKIIISSNNIAEYQQFGYPVVADKYKNIGPIGGIYSAIQYSTTEKNIIVSCDSPFLDVKLFELLLSYSDKYQVVMPSHGNGLLEPLAAYYSQQILPKIEESIKENDYKLINIFNKVLYKIVNVEHKDFFTKQLFSNFNTPDDLLKNG